jgi:galactonate dehydratase
MIITQFELFKVKPRWLFLKVSTGEGISAWGELIVEGRADTTATAVRELQSYLMGRDPLRIGDHFRTLYRCGFYRGGPVLMSALSGIEQALWDIKGKLYGIPVYEMLGGRCRDRVKVYAWIGGDEPTQDADQALARIEQQFRAVKMNATGPCDYIGYTREIDAAVERMRQVRQAVCNDVDIAADSHGRVHKSQAIILAHELEPLHPLFYEEPVLPENNEMLVELSKHTSIPLAVGERMYGRWGFKEVITRGVVSVIQPDISHAGGILECRKIAAMAEAYDIAVAPRCPLGPIAASASLQLDACTPNSVIQELPMQIHYNEGADLLGYLLNKDVFAVHDGYLDVPTGTGFGISIDEDLVRHAATEEFDWKAPVWRLSDGAIAEW